MSEQTQPPVVSRDGGIAAVLRVAFPLIMASSGHAFRLFADRVMLSAYSREAISASMPAGLLCFAAMAFFMGTAGYVNTFVAQYTGAGRDDRVGIAIWQGLYLSLIGGLIVAGSGEFAETLFDWVGHAPEIRSEQVVYFQILSRFGFAGIALSAVNAFWSGRGRTRTVMVVELFSAALNIALNYLLIFGNLGLPRLGILGAGLATGLSNIAGLALALSLLFSRRNRTVFGTFPRRTLNLPLLGRILRFGLPNGLQFALDIVAFNVFIVLMGRAGPVVLEAVNIAFGLEVMAFLPIIGLGMAVSVFVGQGVGAKDITFARHSVRSALLVATVYNIAIATVFVLMPGPILELFARPNDAAQVESLQMAVRCLRYISIYLLFDALYIICSHAIKGAGDTRFAMIAGLGLSWGTLVLPCYIAMRLSMSIWTMWWILVVHVGLAGIVFWLRYRGNRWETMSVIEESPAEQARATGSEVDIQVERGI